MKVIEQRATDEWNAAPKGEVPCDRKVQRGTLSTVCGERPTVELVGRTRGTRGKIVYRCLRHAVSSAYVYRVER